MPDVGQRRREHLHASAEGQPYLQPDQDTLRGRPPRTGSSRSAMAIALGRCWWLVVVAIEVRGWPARIGLASDLGPRLHNEARQQAPRRGAARPIWFCSSTRFFDPPHHHPFYPDRSRDPRADPSPGASSVLARRDGRFVGWGSELSEG